MTTLPPDAFATVTDPASVHFHPALMADAWYRLLDARRIKHYPNRLHPAHRIERKSAVTDWMAAALGRTLLRVRAHAEAQGYSLAATPDDAA